MVWILFKRILPIGINFIIWYVFNGENRIKIVDMWGFLFIIEVRTYINFVIVSIIHALDILLSMLSYLPCQQIFSL